MKLTWRKTTAPDGQRAEVGPFVARVTPKPDGRYSWEIFADGKDSSLAFGIVTSLGQAKTKVEQFIARSGRV